MLQECEPEQLTALSSQSLHLLYVSYLYESPLILQLVLLFHSERFQMVTNVRIFPLVTINQPFPRNWGE